MPAPKDNKFGAKPPGTRAADAKPLFLRPIPAERERIDNWLAGRSGSQSRALVAQLLASIDPIAGAQRWLAAWERVKRDFNSDPDTFAVFALIQTSPGAVALADTAHIWQVSDSYRRALWRIWTEHWSREGLVTTADEPTGRGGHNQTVATRTAAGIAFLEKIIVG